MELHIGHRQDGTACCVVSLTVRLNLISGISASRGRSLQCTCYSELRKSPIPRTRAICQQHNGTKHERILSFIHQGTHDELIRHYLRASESRGWTTCKTPFQTMFGTKVLRNVFIFILDSVQMRNERAAPDGELLHLVDD